MAASHKRAPVPGSEKNALPNAKASGAVDPNERIEVTVVIRRRTGSGSRATKAAASEVMRGASKLPERRQYLAREAFAAERGAAPEDVVKVETFAREHNLTVVEVSIAKRSIRLVGAIRDLTEAFRPNLKRVRVGARVVGPRAGRASVPKSANDMGEPGGGRGHRPAAQAHSRNPW